MPALYCSALIALVFASLVLIKFFYRFSDCACEFVHLVVVADNEMQLLDKLIKSRTALTVVLKVAHLHRNMHLQYIHAQPLQSLKLSLAILVTIHIVACYLITA